MKRSWHWILLLPLLTGCGGPAGLLGVADPSVLAANKSRDAVATVKGYYAPLARRNAQLIAYKYELMAESPFAFFRGSARLYYADVAKDPRLACKTRLPLMGDLHAENLGTYQTSDRQIAYDLNDFDEAFTGPFTWEVARGAVSLLLAADEAGLARKDAEELVVSYLKGYRQQLKRLVTRSRELSQPLTAALVDGPAADAIQAAAKVRREDFLDKLTSHGAFKLGKKVSACAPGVRQQVVEAIALYAQARPEGAGFFRVKDVAQRLAGVASIGRYRYVALLEGRTTSPDDDLVLELKEEGPSAAANPIANEAERVRRAYDYFLPMADAYLGTVRIQDLDFLVRELQPAKGGVELSELKRKDFARFVETISLAVARAHARAPQASQLLAEVEDEAGFVSRLAGFARDYRSQVEADHHAFRKSL